MMLYAFSFGTKTTESLRFDALPRIKSSASSIVMLNRVIPGSVIVMGFFALICSMNFGATEPLLPSTFPYLIPMNLVGCLSLST